MEINPNLISWTSPQNILFLNPRLSPETKNFLIDNASQAVLRNQLSSSIILASSGSTVAEDKFIKLVILSKLSFLKNAEAVTDFLHLTPSDLWLKVLPNHHVGGLAILARSHISKCSVISEEIWDINKVREILQHNPITTISLVPTQVFDLVKNQIKPPASIKFLLVGGGFLNPELEREATKLGWKIWLTYGMTETASMVSLSENHILRPLKNVKFKLNPEGLLGIRSPSLASGVVQKATSGELVYRQIQDSSGWFWTEDSAIKTTEGFILLGRNSDFVKIGGEGTHLQALRQIWEEVSNSNQTTAVWAIPSDRLGHEIQLLIEDGSGDSQESMDGITNGLIAGMIAKFNHRVLPNQKIRSCQKVPSIPRNDLGKILWKKLANK
jgi:O-succinylbenzoic acid--CoA ligase